VPLPPFTASGDLSPGVRRATLSEVLERFGSGSPQRLNPASLGQRETLGTLRVPLAASREGRRSLWAPLTGGVRLKVQMTRFVQAVLATIPVLLTPVLIYALAEGILDFGGGEKDILLAAPWLIWSATFALCSYVLIYRRWLVRKWVLRSGIVSTGLLLGLGLILYATSF
jgi:hypothetical protein